MTQTGNFIIFKHLWWWQNHITLTSANNYDIQFHPKMGLDLCVDHEFLGSREKRFFFQNAHLHSRPESVIKYSLRLLPIATKFVHICTYIHPVSIYWLSSLCQVSRSVKPALTSPDCTLACQLLEFVTKIRTYHPNAMISIFFLIFEVLKRLR